MQHLRPFFFSHATPAGLMLAALVLLSACATVPPPPQIPYTGDPVVDGNAHLAVAPAKDKVMWEYRIAAAAFRQGNFAEAKAKLDDAILQIGGIIAKDASAEKARSFFHREDTKTFIGEPYERVMAYYYRAILYWMDGESDNARACYRTGQLIDSDADNHEYASDYILLDYLDGLVSFRLSEDGSDAYARAVKLSKNNLLPAYDKSANVLCFAEFGHGPTKWAAGEYGEQLRFRTPPSRAVRASLNVDGQSVRLPAYDNLDFQATTRGGRVMDYILGNKAVFKRTSDTVGNVALVGAAFAANNNSHDSNEAAIALAAVGLISKLASAATTPHADVRCWDNLPQYLSFATLSLPAGDHPAVIEYYDREGNLILEFTRQAVLHIKDPSTETIIFLSEFKK